jgi:hypothetical protein
MKAKRTRTYRTPDEVTASHLRGTFGVKNPDVICAK